MRYLGRTMDSCPKSAPLNRIGGGSSRLRERVERPHGNLGNAFKPSLDQRLLDFRDGLSGIESLGQALAQFMMVWQ